jgi:YegS/Rv2252/BmrU family lipid kinase
MPKQKFFLIVNREAGKDKATIPTKVERVLPILFKLLGDRITSDNWLLTRRPGDATKIAQMAARAGYKQILVLSGDGTIQEVAKGLLSFAGKKVSIGIIPGGRGNDFARALGIPANNIERAVEIFFAGKTLEVDVGKVLLGVREEYFLNALGLGIDAQGAANAQKMGNIKSDLAYALGILEELFLFPCSELSLATPFWQYNKKALGAIVANGRSEGKMFKIAPSALLNDGLLNICVIGFIPRMLFPIRFLYAIGAVGGVLEKWHRILPQIYSQKTEKLAIRVPPGWSCHLDGNIIDLTDINRLEVEILPRALRVIAGDCPEISGQ